MFQNFILMVPLFSATLMGAALGASMVRSEGLGQMGVFSQWLGTLATLVGILMVWDRLKNRYGFTHDLRWSLNSKRVGLAFASVIAGIIVLSLSTILPR